MEPTRTRDFEMQQLRLFCSSKSLLSAVIKENVTFYKVHFLINLLRL